MIAARLHGFLSDSLRRAPRRALAEHLQRFHSVALLFAPRRALAGRLHCLLLSLALLLAPLPALAAPEARLEAAERALSGGELPAARAEARLALSEATAAPALAARAHAVLAAVFAAEGADEAAADAFVAAFAADPLLTLDPVLFAPDVRALADRVRTERRAEIERRRAPAPATPTDAPRPARSAALALVPFGAGQFQNDQPGKGAFFVASEGLATLAALGGIAAVLSLRGADGSFAAADVPAAETWNVVWVAGAWSFVGLHALGAADALWNLDAGEAP